MTTRATTSILPLDESLLRKDHLLSIYNALKNWSPDEQRKFLEENITNVTPLLPFIEYLFSSETIHTELLYDFFKLAFISINQKAVLEKQSTKRRNRGTSLDSNNKRKSARLLILRNKIYTPKIFSPQPLPSPLRQEKEKTPVPIKRKASDLLEQNCPTQLESTSPEIQRKIRKPCPARKFANVVYQGWKKPEI
ncbi:unnamed protein product [Allacma fusca]|uniref:Uncharacterized protein n=1 Tax=Allacma fusca TaxID=39272 RepID=A0A8J2JH23_9HEXA|nr:unnamed protein product [Allacma fusca]